MNALTLGEPMPLEQFVSIFITLIILSSILKAWALWIAARNKHKLWFVVLFLVNTLGIIDLIYIFLIGKPKLNQPEAPRKAM